jgi:hypothetical protein
MTYLGRPRRKRAAGLRRANRIPHRWNVCHHTSNDAVWTQAAYPMTFSGFIRVIQDYVGTNKPENQELLGSFD